MIGFFAFFVVFCSFFVVAGLFVPAVFAAAGFGGAGFGGAGSAAAAFGGAGPAAAAQLLPSEALACSFCLSFSLPGQQVGREAQQKKHICLSTLFCC
jgi:hypothetical protein